VNWVILPQDRFQWPTSEMTTMMNIEFDNTGHSCYLNIRRANAPI
jgi:hypothetical protein